jgi:uncharacterized protein YhaN
MTEVIIKSGSKADQQAAQSLLHEALRRQKLILQSALQRTLEKLSQFEKQYQLNSDRFFTLFQSGSLDDRNDYIDWAGEYQIEQNLRGQLNCLEELVLCE